MNSIKHALVGGIAAVALVLPGGAGAMSYVQPQYAYPDAYQHQWQNQYYGNHGYGYGCGYNYPCQTYGNYYYQYQQPTQYYYQDYQTYSQPYYQYQNYTYPSYGGCDALYTSGQPACGNVTYDWYQYQQPQTTYYYQDYQYPQYQYANYYNGYGYGGSTGNAWGIGAPQYYYSI